MTRRSTPRSRPRSTSADSTAAGSTPPAAFVRLRSPSAARACSCVTVRAPSSLEYIASRCDICLIPLLMRSCDCLGVSAHRGTLRHALPRRSAPFRAPKAGVAPRTGGREPRKTQGGVHQTVLALRSEPDARGPCALRQSTAPIGFCAPNPRPAGACAHAHVFARAS
jgi:hypothetical protein